jgi:hypothetical protein
LFIGDILHPDERRAQRIGAVCSIWGLKLDLLLLVSVYEVARQKYANATTSSDGLSTATWRKEGVISQWCTEEISKAVSAILMATWSPCKVKERDLLLASGTGSLCMLRQVPRRSPGGRLATIFVALIGETIW